MHSRHRDISGLSGSQRQQTPIATGNNYLFVVAIDEYEHLPKLYNCVKDANDVIQQLVYKYSFQEEHVIKLFNKDASIGNIYKRLLELSRVVTEKDNFMIYFSGHGFYDKDNETGHLIPVNAEKGNVWDYLSNSDFLNSIRAIKSMHTLVVLDSCFSGSMFSTKSIAPTYADNVSNYKSRWGLAAGRIEVVDDGLHGENSPFANAIINFLKENTTTKFPVSDLIQYVKKVTTNNSGQTPIAGPIKNLGDEGGEFVFQLKTDVATEWQKALSTNTAQSYTTFIANYPESPYTEEAKDKLRPLKEMAMWKEIQHMPHKELSDVIEKQRMVAEYKFDYPNGKFIIKANELAMHLNETEALLTKKRAHQTFTGNSHANTNANQSASSGAIETPAQNSDNEPGADGIVNTAEDNFKYNKTVASTTSTTTTTSKGRWLTIRKLIAFILIPVIAIVSFFATSFFNKETVVGDLDEIAFHKLETSENLKDYNDFIYGFPKSYHVAEAQAMKDELAYWQKVVAKHEKQGYENYLLLFEDGRFSSKAENEIKLLEEKNPPVKIDVVSTKPIQNSPPIVPPVKTSKPVERSPEDIAWDKLKNSNSVKDMEALREFIMRYTSGKNVTKASKLLGALDLWEKTIKKHTLKDYEAYQFYYPNGPHKAQSEKAAKALRANEDNTWKKTKSKNSENGYFEFIRVYPKSKYAKDAKANIEKLNNRKKNKGKDSFRARERWYRATVDNTPKAYKDFIRTYPKSEKAVEAQTRLDQLKGKKINPHPKK